MIIYIAFPLTKVEQDLLRKGVDSRAELLFKQELSDENSQEAFMKAEVTFGNPPLEWVRKSDRLRWLQLYSAGLDPYQQLAKDGPTLPFAVTNLRNFFGEPVAETAVAGILALYRKLDELTRLQSKGQWVGGRTLRPQMRLLQGKRVLILGAGAIGNTVQKLLTGFSCSVQIISRSTNPTLADLDQLLPEADIVVNCLPETPETRQVLHAERIGNLKPTALLVNVGRGSAVDEKALIHALQSGKLAGAVLDVSEKEPIPVNHPLWTCPNVLLTQHTGGGYDAENADKVKVFLENLRRYRAGEPLQNVVDLARGY